MSSSVDFCGRFRFHTSDGLRAGSIGEESEELSLHVVDSGRVGLPLQGFFSRSQPTRSVLCKQAQKVRVQVGDSGDVHRIGNSWHYLLLCADWAETRARCL